MSRVFVAVFRFPSMASSQLIWLEFHFFNSMESIYRRLHYGQIQ